MDFEWTNEQKELRLDAIKFTQKVNPDNMIDLDRNSIFSKELWKKYGEFGVMGCIAPREFGGLELDLLSVVALMEGLGYGSVDNGLLFSINAHLWSCVEPLIHFGTEIQKEKYLHGLCDGSLIGVHAMTEPGSGSDAYSLRTICNEQDGEYVLNGNKMFITNGNVADVILVFANLIKENGAKELSCFIVEKDTPGFSSSKTIEKMGLRTSPFSELIFANCRIPKTNILGSEGMGKLIFAHAMDAERACIFACQIGVMERQIEKCKKYALERRQFQKTIFDFQAVSHMLANMKVNLETSRLLVYKVAYKRMKGLQSHLDSAIAKLHTSECFLQNSISAMRIHGGYGYTVEYEIEREIRDALGAPLYSGTSEIMKNVIAELID